MSARAGAYSGRRDLAAVGALGVGVGETTRAPSRDRRLGHRRRLVVFWWQTPVGAQPVILERRILLE